MKIAHIKISNHEILGDIELNFCDGKGQPYDSIIIAGENGSGKSTLLELLLNCFFIHPINELSKTKVEYEFVVDDNDVEIIKRAALKAPKGNRIKIFKDYSKTNWSQIITSYTDNSSEQVVLPSNQINELLKDSLKTIYSDVAINFKSRELSNVTSQEIDSDTNRQKRSTEELATEITQLFIDIATSDALDLTDWVREHIGQIPPKILIDTRMSRFTNAFHSMFPTKKFSKIENNNGKKVVLFSENGKLIPLSKFSSGEKQIVFRGAFILRDKNKTDGALVFIDEPEISLHPRWQMKILNFYKDLFKNESGIQTSQIFFATHSSFIIHNENRYNDKVIVIERDNNGKCVIKDSDAEYFNWKPESIVKDAFKIDTSIPIDRKSVFVEGELDEEYFNKTIEVFDRKDLTFEVKWIGRRVGKGKNEFSGESALDTMKTVLLVHPKLLRTKVVLYYDNDITVQEHSDGHLIVKSAPTENLNKFYVSGIESLLNLPTNFPKPDFDSTKTEKKKDKTVTITEVDKRKLCEWVKNQGDAKSILSRLNDILSGLKDDLK